MLVLDEVYLKKYNIEKINSISDGTFAPRINIKYSDGKVIHFDLRAGVDMYDAIDYHVKEQYILTRPKKIEKIMKRIWQNQK